MRRFGTTRTGTDVHGRTRTFFVIAFVVGGVAFGDSLGEFESRLKQGFNLLEGGDTQGAVAEFRDLQVAQPESEVVTYSLASAKYKQGLLDAKNQAPEDAITRFSEARTAFDELHASEDPFIRFNAAYNAANCSAQIAKNSIGSGKHDETVAAFEESIQEYERLREQRPDHEGVQTNLNHMRYLLKTLMQNPPPEQQQQSGEGEEEEKQEGEDEGEQEEQQQQPSEEEQNGEPNEEEQQDEQQETQENPQEFNSSAEENQEETEPLNRQNIEAILQSLEDQDREEQKKLRRADEPPRIVNRKWW